MKKLAYTFAVVTAMLCLTAGSLHSAVEAEKPQLESDKKTEKLLSRIAQLEKRVAELEKLKSVKITNAPVGDFYFKSKLKQRLNEIDVMPSIDPYPRGWKQKQINGMKYFIVPLSLPQGLPQ